MSRKKSGEEERINGQVFGKRLSQKMHERSISAQHMADLLGVTKNYVELMKKGDKIPSSKLLFRILELLQCTPDELLFDYLGPQGDPWREHHFAMMIEQIPEHSRPFIIEVCEKFVDEQSKKDN